MEQRKFTKIFHENPLYTQCAIWLIRVIGQYLFKSDVGKTVHDIFYRQMIIRMFLLVLNNIDLKDKWIEQDGVTIHFK